MWPIVQGINFRFVPVRHQLLAVNTVCYFDDVFLTYVEHNGLPEIFQGIERWWAGVIGIPLDQEPKGEHFRKVKKPKVFNPDGTRIEATKVEDVTKDEKKKDEKKEEKKDASKEGVVAVKKA